MSFNISIPAYSINTETQYMAKLPKGNTITYDKQFPILTIGTDSYIGSADIYLELIDSSILSNIHIGRYSSIAEDIKLLVDMNHDYRRVSQGRISGTANTKPHLINRKGEITIMNDCWIGNNVTILSGVTIGNGAVVATGSIVTKDVPSYAIVAGNPATIIGYRFNKEQISALNIIRWWNWTIDKIQKHHSELQGDIDIFINNNIKDAQKSISSINPLEIKRIPKNNSKNEKIYLYIPDFEQECPTYPKVIDAFAETFSETDNELLLYIKEDELLQEKLNVLDKIFSKYNDKNCYINLYVGIIEDERALFNQVDYYITNRSIDNIYHVDLAQLFNVKVISCMNIPMFSENSSHQYMIKQG